MIKTIAILAQLIIPSPNSHRAQVAFDLLTTDYAGCHAYFDLRASFYKIDEPLNMAKSMGAMAAMGYEGHRMEALANLPTGTFDDRRHTFMTIFQRILDDHGFSSLYSRYDNICENLKDDPGGAFISHLPEAMKK